MQFMGPPNSYIFNSVINFDIMQVRKEGPGGGGGEEARMVGET